MRAQELSKEYELKSNDELLRLALDPSQLTEEAYHVLSIELHKRNLARGQMENFREHENMRKEEQDRDIGRLRTYRGTGRKRFCKGDYSFDQLSETEEFTTTIFIVFCYLPLIPTGTYRVKKKKEFFSNKMEVIEKLPLNWEQVMKVWLVMLLSILCLILAVKLLDSRP